MIRELLTGASVGVLFGAGCYFCSKAWALLLGDLEDDDL